MYWRDACNGVVMPEDADVVIKVLTVSVCVVTMNDGQLMRACEDSPARRLRIEVARHWSRHFAV
jgi:hypothetical protein